MVTKKTAPKVRGLDSGHWRDNYGKDPRSHTSPEKRRAALAKRRKSVGL